jgi:NADPH:quinone reductase-like Zn-dependent oxidoreductase
VKVRYVAPGAPPQDNSQDRRRTMPTAYVYTQHGGPEHEMFVEVEKPLPGPGEICVAVHAAGVNPADWKRRAGMTRGGALDHPVGLGREVSGTVEALGDGVTGFAPGDEVLAQVADGPRGGFATYALVAASWTAPKPAGVSFTDAAALPIAAATAYDGINQLDLHSGATLLVIGAGGGVGIAACQFAHNRGARVIGVASAAKRELVEAVGAVHVPSGDNAMTDARSLAPNGVDGLFDLVGGTALLGLGTLVDDGSRIVTAADEATAVALGGARVRRERTRSVLEAIVDMVDAGTFSPYVTEVFPLARARHALGLVEAGHAKGKLVLQVA